MTKENQRIQVSAEIARAEEAHRAAHEQHFILPKRLHVDRARDLSRLEQFRTEADYNRFFAMSNEGAGEELGVADRFRDAARKYLAAHGWLGPGAD